MEQVQDTANARQKKHHPTFAQPKKGGTYEWNPLKRYNVVAAHTLQLLHGPLRFALANFRSRSLPAFVHDLTEGGHVSEGVLGWSSFRSMFCRVSQWFRWTSSCGNDMSALRTNGAPPPEELSTKATNRLFSTGSDGASMPQVISSYALTLRSVTRSRIVTRAAAALTATSLVSRSSSI